MTRTPGRREQATAETRRLILAAAKELYLEKGYRQAPSKELARRAGVAEGTVFAHFPDKASLLAAALDEDIERTLRQAWGTLPAHVPCRDELLHLAGAFYAYYAGQPELSRALVKESLFLAGEWGQRVTEGVYRFIALVGERIEAAKLRGEYRGDVDALQVGRSFFAAYYLELMAGLSAPRFDADKALTELAAHIHLWERGLLTGETRDKP